MLSRLHLTLLKDPTGEVLIFIAPDCSFPLQDTLIHKSWPPRIPDLSQHLSAGHLPQASAALAFQSPSLAMES